MKFLNPDLLEGLHISKKADKDFEQVINNLDKKSMIAFRRNIVFRTLTASLFLIMAEDFNERLSTTYDDMAKYDENAPMILKALNGLPVVCAMYMILSMLHNEYRIRGRTLHEEQLKKIYKNKVPNGFIIFYLICMMNIAYGDKFAKVFELITKNLNIRGLAGDQPAQDLNRVIYLNTPEIVGDQLFGYYLTGTSPTVIINGGIVDVESSYTAESTEYTIVPADTTHPYPIDATFIFESSVAQNNTVLPIKMVHGSEVYMINSAKVETYDIEGNPITLTNIADYEIRRYPDGTHRLFITNTDFIGNAFIINYSMHKPQGVNFIELKGDMPKLDAETLAAMEALFTMVTGEDIADGDLTNSLLQFSIHPQYDRDTGNSMLVADTILEYIDNLITQKEKDVLRVECENSSFLGTLISQAHEQLNNDLSVADLHVALGYKIDKGQTITPEGSNRTWTGLGNVGHNWNLAGDGVIYDFTPSTIAPDGTVDSFAWLSDTKISELGVDSLREKVKVDASLDIYRQLRGINWGELTEYIGNLVKSLVLLAALVILTKKFGMKLLSATLKQQYLGLLDELELIKEVRKYLEDPNVTDPMYIALHYLITAQYSDGSREQELYQERVDSLYPTKRTSDSIFERLQSLLPNSYETDENKADRMFWYLSMVNNTDKAFNTAKRNILESGHADANEIAKALDDFKSIQQKFSILRKKKKEQQQREIALSKLIDEDFKEESKIPSEL